MRLGNAVRKTQHLDQETTWEKKDTKRQASFGKVLGKEESEQLKI